MPLSSDASQTLVPNDASPVATGLRASSDYSSLSSVRGFQGRSISSARGLEDLTRSTTTAASIYRDSALSSDQKTQVDILWSRAQISGQNFGLDIKQLVPLFEQRPDLLNKLHAIANAETLFGIAKKDVSPKAFEAMRAEFLVEAIRGSVNPALLAQGETSTCTACKALSATSAENILNLSCSLALNATAKTIGGDTVKLGTDLTDYKERLIPYAERVSGLSLQGDGNLSRRVDSINTRLPSFGMSLVYGALLEMKGG
jgi:hypothetical protein